MLHGFHTIILHGVLIRLSASGRSVQVYYFQVLLLASRMLDLVSSVGLVPMRYVIMNLLFGPIPKPFILLN